MLGHGREAVLNTKLVVNSWGACISFYIIQACIVYETEANDKFLKSGNALVMRRLPCLIKFFM